MPSNQNEPDKQDYSVTTERINDHKTNRASSVDKNVTNLITANNEGAGEKKKESKNNYLQNILYSSTNGLVLADKKLEESTLTDSKTVVRFSPIWKQTLAAASSILLTFSAGLTSGYSAILIPQLKHNQTAIPTDESTTSWIASIAALPMAPGCLLSGWLLEKYGRKTSHYIVCAPFLIGWILIAAAYNLPLMLLGRFLTGLCVGLLGPLGPVYISETTEPKYRGFFLAGICLGIAVGIVFAHVVGTFVHWQWTAAICSVFSVLAIVLLIFSPESPTWLISQGRIEDGVKAFYWLRGYGDEAKTELKALIDKKIEADAIPELTWLEKVKYLRSPELLKPLFVMIVFFVTCQFSGVNAIVFYSIDIVERAVGKDVDHYLAMLVIDVLRLISAIAACVICKQYGRRPLGISSGIFTALSMIALSMYLYWKPPNMIWIPLTCLVAYIVATSLGLVPLPWMMCGELFPTKVRGLGSGISSATTFISFFFVVKTMPGMMTNFGEVITFLFYGIVAFIGTAILYFILPETKGKSLQEIEEKYTKKKELDPKV